MEVYNVPAEWVAYFMYLCVNANSRKAWESGLAGASVAKQICAAAGLPYSRRKVINSLGSQMFASIALRMNYRELNELAKFARFKTNEMGPSAFHYSDGDQEKCLDLDRIETMSRCLWDWRTRESGALPWGENP